MSRPSSTRTTIYSCKRINYYGSLEKDLDILKSDSCGTHVHVSLLDQNSQAGQRPAFPYLKRIAQAVVCCAF